MLFADLVGFTARAESLDPEDVDAFLRPYHERLRTELERWGGTVEKFIGDAVVAAFGAPIAREDDPERAVRAALAIRDWAAEQEDVEVRVAVNTGEALVSLDVRPESGEGFLSGDVVNTASRLQAAAPVNGILVGEQTHRATREVIDYRDAQPVVAKGKSEPVPVWEAVRGTVTLRRRRAPARRGVARRPRTRALHPRRGPRTRQGRAHTAARDARRRAGDRQEPARLGALRNDRARRRARVLAPGPLASVRRGRELLGLAEMVKAQAGVLDSDSADAAGEKLRRAVDDSSARRTPSGSRHICGRCSGSARDARFGRRREEAFAAWRRFFEALADRRPLVLVFEDLHFADDGLARLRRRADRVDDRHPAARRSARHGPSCSSAGPPGAAAS